MIECIASTHVLFWVLTGLLILSEALGETKLVRANGVLSFILNTLKYSFRVFRRIIFGR